MPKHDFFSPKAIANRQKAKGLQKLRWYCQICEKQCRDENGYKCHLQSEGHQRQALLFASHSGKYLQKYSTQFMNGFVSLLSRRYGTTKVFANTVYKEYISDPQHIHMNGTHWSTLNGFVRYLSKKGIVKLEETERGPYIQWIDSSLKTLEKQAAVLKQERMKKDQEEKDRLMIERQIQKGKLMVQNEEHQIEKKPEKSLQSTEKIKISLGGLKRKLGASTSAPSKSLKSETDSNSSKTKEKEKFTDFNEERENEADQQEVDFEDEPVWIEKGLIVKIMNKTLLDGKLYKSKAIITQVHPEQPYLAFLKLIHQPNLQLKIDQSELETVLPSLQSKVKVVNGQYKGQIGTLKSLLVEEYMASVQLDGDLEGEETLLEYDYICKFQE